MSRARARRLEVSPAALGSIGLHVAVAAAFMMTWGSRDLKVGSVVPVTIVSHAPDADTRPAIQGPETLEAATEDPVAEAPPEPAPPPPQPAPPPPTAKAAPTPTPKPTTPVAKPSPKPAEKSFDLDALSASLKVPARNAPQRPSGAVKGPTRAETAPIARQTAGTGLAAGAAVQGLADELQRRWNPNCDVEGGRDVLVQVKFMMGIGGQVVGDVTSEIKSARSPVSLAGSERAIRAVYAAAPFRNLPREIYGNRITVNFDAREACAR